MWLSKENKSNNSDLGFFIKFSMQLDQQKYKYDIWNIIFHTNDAYNYW